MESFEHRYVLHIGFLSIIIPKKALLSVLKLLHKIFPDKKWIIEIK